MSPPSFPSATAAPALPLNSPQAVAGPNFYPPGYPGAPAPAALPNPGWAPPPANPPPVPPPSRPLPGQPPTAYGGPWGQPVAAVPVSVVPAPVVVGEPNVDIGKRRARILKRKSREQSSLLIVSLLFGGLLFFGLVIVLLVISLLG